MTTSSFCATDVFVITWKYVVASQHRDAFEFSYGALGEWVRLFSESAGYLGSDLITLDPPGTYLVVDRWRSEGDYNEFRSLNAAEYSSLDRQLQHLRAGEELISRGAGPSPPPRRG